MPKKSFEQASQEFNQKYGMNFSLAEVERVERKFAAVNSFLLTKDSRKSPRALYVGRLSKALAACVNAHTNMSATGSYDLSNFSIAEFVYDFDALMQAKYEEGLQPGQEPTRKPYEGASYTKLLGAMVQFTQNYNKTLPTVWSENVLNKLSSVESMKAITESSYRYLTQDVKFSGSAEAVTGPVEKDNLTNVLGALQAMEKIRQQRGFFWKLFCRSQNKAEKEYIATLRLQVQELAKMGYPTHEVNATLSENVLDDAQQKANDNIVMRNQYKQNKKKFEKQQAEEQARKEDKALLVSPKLNAKIEEFTFQYKFSKQLGGVLPEGGFGAAKTGMVESAMDGLVATLKDTNELYDRQRVNGTSEQDAMKFYVKQVFYKTFEMTDMLGYFQLKDRVLAAQKMTDEIMKEVSPVSLAKDGLAPFANGYILDNSDIIMEGLVQDSGLDQDSLERAFDGAKKEYGREQVNVVEAAENVNAAKAPQVNDEPKIENPVKQV